MATHEKSPALEPRRLKRASQFARWSLVALGNVLLAGLLGAIVVAMPMGPRELAAIVWVIVLVLLVRRTSRRGERRLAAMILLVNVAVGCGLLMAAIAAPGKTRDKVLERRMVLPQRELTLTELHRYLESIDQPRNAVPTYVALRFSADKADTEVRFPAENLTLREFVGAIEAQTPLRAKFASCGNGHTFLWGEDCCFGLYLRDRGRPY